MEHRPRVEGSRAEDVALAQAVVGGSLEAWHTFIHRYSRLILAVIHRYIPRRRQDEARSLHADVLETLYRGKLGTYEGRSALSTWLVLVTRSVVIDALRRRLGGRDLHEALESLEPFERQVFRHYYVEGMSFGAVRQLVRDQGALVTIDRLLGALRRIEERVSGRFARRLRYDLHAQSVGGSSGRLLEYMDHARWEFEERADGQHPDYESFDAEVRLTLSAIQAELASLPADERRLLSLRFEHGWTASRIAEELGLEGQRAVYTWIDRVVRVLRRAAKGPPRSKRSLEPREPVALTGAGRVTRPGTDGERGAQP